MMTKRFRFHWNDFLQRFSGLLILLALGLFLANRSEFFLTQRNLTNIALQTSILTIVAFGVAMTMLTGGIDLSVGSVAAFSGAVCAGLLVHHEINVLLAIVAALLVGISIGLVNGLLIVFGKLPPFVATLATMAIARGMTLVYTDGRPITVLDEPFVYLGNGYIGPVPVPVCIMLLLFFFASFLLTQTKLGRAVYAIGGNAKTAHLAGINVTKGTVFVYGFSAFTASLGGILLTARLWSAQPTTGVGLELEAIAAAVLGGASLFGGVGSILGVIIGVMIIGMLSNGLNLLEISSYYQQVIKGIVFVLAVILDMYAKKRKTVVGK